MEFVRNLSNFYYDPARQGFDTGVFKTIIGTAPTIVSDELAFVNGGVVTRFDLGRGEITFRLKIPAIPTTGDNRQWGLYQYSFGASIFFSIVGTAFRAIITTNGSTTETATITWSSAWTNAFADYRIRFTPSGAQFYINDQFVALLNGPLLPKVPLSVAVINQNAGDTVTLKAIEFRDAEVFSSNLSSISSIGTGASSLGKAEDAAHASGDVGIEMLAKRTDTAASSAGTDGDYTTVNSDSLGHLWMREGFAPGYENNTDGVASVGIKPLATSTYSWTRFVNFGANATLNVKASAGNIKSLYCHNLNGSPRYIQLHNTATTPAVSAVPLFTFLVPAGGVVQLDGAFFGENGYNFTTGIAFAFSTDEGIYTAGTAADQFTTIMYK